MLLKGFGFWSLVHNHQIELNSSNLNKLWQSLIALDISFKLIFHPIFFAVWISRVWATYDCLLFVLQYPIDFSKSIKVCVGFQTFNKNLITQPSNQSNHSKKITYKIIIKLGYNDRWENIETNSVAMFNVYMPHLICQSKCISSDRKLWI